MVLAVAVAAMAAAMVAKDAAVALLGRGGHHGAGAVKPPLWEAGVETIGQEQ